ncbi:MAG: HalX domain-containing protein [Halapricum sp.]
MSESDPVVLVVDDERGLADLYAAWLSGSYETRVAYGGEEALERLDDDVSIVLLDRRMPGFSGDEVLAEIESRNLDCQVAMVTAVEPDFDIIEMGFDDYLTKPVSQDDLLGTVESLLDRRQYEAALTELFSLVSKKAALVEQKSPEELADNDAYQDLLDRIESLESETHRLVTAMDSLHAAAVFRQLDLGVSGEDE